jgi:hypothetical protein
MSLPSTQGEQKGPWRSIPGWFLAAWTIAVPGLVMLSYRQIPDMSWNERVDMVSAFLVVGSLLIAPVCLLATTVHDLLHRTLAIVRGYGTLAAALIGGSVGFLVMLTWPPLSLLAPDALYTGVVAGILSQRSQVLSLRWWAWVLAGSVGFVLFHMLAAPVLIPLMGRIGW